MPGWISPWELLILVFVVLLVFGPKRLPEMGRSLGRGMREFKNSITGKEERKDAPEPSAIEAPKDVRADRLTEELRVERRERLIEQALHEGRFGAEEADDYRRLYDAEPESTMRSIEKLPVRAAASERTP